ncbi:MAG TPA: hypothetical protein VFF69_08750, partial [Phycisphaerales bacterium]|nr:hypothetical protein [Phycisphaerales bacterium]
MSGKEGHGRGFHGPMCWVLTACIGLLAGAILSVVAPGHYGEHPRDRSAAPADAPSHVSPPGETASGASGQQHAEPAATPEAHDDVAPPAPGAGAHDARRAPAKIPPDDLGPQGPPSHEAAADAHG